MPIRPTRLAVVSLRTSAVTTFLVRGSLRIVGSDGWDVFGYGAGPEDAAIPEVFNPDEYADRPAEVEASAAERAHSAPSQATELVQLARTRYTVVRGDDSRSYAVAHDLPGIAVELGGGVRQQLAAWYFDEKGKAAGGSAKTDAIAVLEGEAMAAGETHISIRVGSDRGRVVIDLGTPNGRAIVVDPSGWKVEDQSPILFRRNKATLALPEPVRTGSIEHLRVLLNVDVPRFRLVVAWMLGALFSDMPHPILALTGLQGAAKSSAARTVLSIIDPSVAAIRSIPRTEEDWAVSAWNAYAFALDNVSHLAPWLQDALCRAVTGDAFLRRERYSDVGISVVDFRRPLIITTIDPGSLQGDVADRLLPVELQPISPSQRLTDAEVTAAVEKARPGILGALVDLLAQVLKVLPTVELSEKPRMADFAELLAALDEVTGWSTLPDYLEAAASGSRNVVDGDQFALAISVLAQAEGRWEGTCSDLMARLENEKHAPDWPKSPRAAQSRIQRLTPALATRGVKIDRPKQKTNRGQMYRISFHGEGACEACGQALNPALIEAGDTTHPTC